MHYVPPVEIQNTMYETVLQGSSLNLNLIKHLDLTTGEHRVLRNRLCTTAMRSASKTQLLGKIYSAGHPIFSTKILQRDKKEMERRFQKIKKIKRPVNQLQCMNTIGSLF